jgi:hypothetical protein
MTDVTFKGKELKLHLSTYRIRMIGEELGYEYANEAFMCIAEILSKSTEEFKEGKITVRTLRDFPIVFKHMVLGGGNDGIEFSDEEYHDILTDEASQQVIEEYFNSLPPEVVTRKKKAKAKK